MRRDVAVNVSSVPTTELWAVAGVTPNVPHGHQHENARLEVHLLL